MQVQAHFWRVSAGCSELEGFGEHFKHCLGCDALYCLHTCQRIDWLKHKPSFEEFQLEAAFLSYTRTYSLSLPLSSSLLALFPCFSLFLSFELRFHRFQIRMHACMFEHVCAHARIGMLVIQKSIASVLIRMYVSVKNSTT